MCTHTQTYTHSHSSQIGHTHYHMCNKSFKYKCCSLNHCLLIILYQDQYYIPQCSSYNSVMYTSAQCLPANCKAVQYIHYPVSGVLYYTYISNMNIQYHFIIMYILYRTTLYFTLLYLIIESSLFKYSHFYPFDFKLYNQKILFDKCMRE